MTFEEYIETLIEKEKEGILNESDFYEGMEKYNTTYDDIISCLEDAKKNR